MSQPRRRSARGKRGQGTSSDLSNTGIENERHENPVAAAVATVNDRDMDKSSIVSALRRQPVWVVLAVSSGACAAFNGVFAKLTTTALTSTLSSHIATLFSLSPTNGVVEFLVRGTFFLLNLAFNAAMWALFTAALTRSDSTTRVSIVNVSANFMITAILGWMVFNEKLNGMFWGGAALLAAGNVVIGRREEQKPAAVGVPGGIPVSTPRTSGDEAEELLLPDLSGGEPERGRNLEVELDDTGAAAAGQLRARSSEEHRRLRRAEEADDPI
ncbi:hypothetical protein ABEF92_003364 [Exophiala dermatitidis]|uniref:EamA domain-containing protein n=1 Tax=Exophiala dermatitidis (strain ATCC 34100 / CBS 525.76 / NIH/UT8656) TaxID=858893 RepID=H6BKT2_EXODN|nr:uncharacterized protein HMPREF1120_00925 [Exophiala dermatitidis NIH/UT8656]EHY52716.1 hypothetical protein HMPREF1120_00925 [Exophiala dermatitidis NIH/UT8656]